MRDLIKSRIRSKIKMDADTKCWNWTGAKNQDGYGLMANYNGTISAHRISYMVYISDFLKENKILHKCDNPSCVNPEHLFIGTHTDNMRDMIRKGRAPNKNCDKNPKSKLSKSDVDEIRELYFTGDYTQKEIGDIFDVYQSTISYIVRGTKWKEYLNGS